LWRGHHQDRSIMLRRSTILAIAHKRTHKALCVARKAGHRGERCRILLVPHPKRANSAPRPSGGEIHIAGFYQRQGTERAARRLCSKACGESPPLPHSR
jgi:hypothetical protein